MSPSTSLLDGRDLSARHGRETVFSDVSISLMPHSVTVLVGPNGAGKSTLLRILSGLREPSSGRVSLAGHALTAVAPRERARRLGVLLDVPETTFGFTARELVLMGRYPHLGRLGLESEADRDRASRALADLGLGALADRLYPSLSSGEKQRVALARLLCQDPEILLLDEPTSRLDPAHAHDVALAARRLATAGKAVLVVVHDLDLAMRLAAPEPGIDGRLAVLAEGGLAAIGDPGEVLTPELVARVWGVRARRVDDGRLGLLLDGRASR